MADTIVYTTPTCPYCRYVKDFLNRENIPFQEKNVAADRQAAMEMVNRTGQQGVPVTFIAGESIIGFDQPALKAAVTRLRQQGGVRGALKLGAKVADAAAVLEKQGKKPVKGAILGEINPGSLAAKAGLREGDIILALQGQAIHGADELAQELKRIVAANIKEPTVTVWRDEREAILYLPVS